MTAGTVLAYKRLVRRSLPAQSSVAGRLCQDIQGDNSALLLKHL